MAGSYVSGILLAVLAGSMNALGAILQKSAVNRIVSRSRGGSFTAQFLRSPVWLFGLAVSIGLGTVFNMAAQNRIGPALVPGLTASGMVVLAFGSAWLLHERLRPTEMLGIALLIAGIASLGLSRLQIPRSEVDLLDSGTQLRLAAFSAGLAFCWGASWLIARSVRNLSRGILLALSAGLPFCLSNLWILPLLMTIGPVFSGTARAAQVVIFLLSCVILVVANMLGIRQTQESYRFAPASRAQPLQQVTTQISPILIYLTVFRRTIEGAAIVLAPAGVALILLGGTLLAQRRAELRSGEAAPASGTGDAGPPTSAPVG